MAGPWTTYNQTSELIADGTVDLDAAGRFRVVLVNSGYTANRTHTTWGDIRTNELSTGNGYTANGFGITQTWTRSGATTTFDSDDPTWAITTATVSARYAVLMHDANNDGTIATADVCLAYCLLDNTPADHLVAPGNNFIVQINAGGIFRIQDA